MRLSTIAIAIALCSTAAAQPDSGQQHSTRAQALYHDGKYREAHAEFAAGFDASKLPVFMFDMAECSRLLGDAATARDEYTKFLALDPNGKLAAVAKQRLAALPPPAATPPPATPPPATPPAPSPTPPAPASAPPPTTHAVTVAAGPSVPTPAVAAEHAEAAHATPIQTAPIDQPTPLWKRKSVWVAVGLAVAAGTVVTIAATRHSDCTGTCLDWTKQP